MANAIEKKYGVSRDKLYAALLGIVTEMGYTVTSHDPASRTISFKTGVSRVGVLGGFSYGQKMDATVLALGEHESKIILSGKPRMPTEGLLLGSGETDKIAAKVWEKLDSTVIEIPEPSYSQSTSAPSTGATKPCPQCAETIKAAAKVCRFCNHRFEHSFE